MKTTDFRVNKVENGYTVHVEGQTDEKDYMTKFFRTHIAPTIEDVKKYVDEYFPEKTT